MPDAIAAAVVVLSGAYLLWLAASALAAPARAARFLDGFAGSARAHYAEMLVRLIVGASLLQYAPRMQFTTVFVVVGWTLVVTTLPLLLVPWRWHRRIARRATPYAARYPRLFGVASALLGLFVLAATLRGAAL